MEEFQQIFKGNFICNKYIYLSTNTENDFHLLSFVRISNYKQRGLSSFKILCAPIVFSRY